MGASVSFHLFRTVFFLIPAIAIYTIVLGALSLASSLFSRNGRFAHYCARAWAWLILATTGVDVDIRGLERVPRGRPYLFISNHQSIYDIPVLFWYLPFQLRIISKDSIGRFPVLGWHLARTGHVLVQRHNPGATVFKKVSALMRAGHSLLVFPEGTRSRDGVVGRFKGGIFLLAIEAGLPIVPVAIDGTRRVMRKGMLTTCPGSVRVTVFDPIETAQWSPDATRALADRVRTVIASGVVPDAPSPHTEPRDLTLAPASQTQDSVR
jgi:1-acyl-sn-glycerol-3-phosphate acyltransferase